MPRVLGLTGALLLICALASAQELDWWKTATFYQVYPRSFKDLLELDGIGDIPGIKKMVDHFVDIGIGGVWLSPIFKSPMKDFGYDISDFRDVDPIFGNMADLEELATEIHARDLKLVLDFVPNHSSNEHDWFVRSVAREDPYTDYYVWEDAKGLNSTGHPIPPNNWLSVFGGSAWEWREERQQFYLHQFVVEQPDLNYRNPLVLEEMKAVLEFWLDKGVDGFRFDAVAFIMEDPELRDEPLSGAPGFTPEQWGFLDHVYTTGLPEHYDVIREFRSTIDRKQTELNRPLVMMVEAYTSIEKTMLYYGNATHPGAHFPFNFEFISTVDNATDAQGLVDVISSWYDNMPAGAWANWVVGNHDTSRVAARFGREFGLTAVILGQLLPGTAITYNGEEINMEDTWISWQDTQDPGGCNAGEEYYEKFSRDPARTPFQWSAEPNAGFSAPDSRTPWLPINPNYETLNVEVQKEAENSPYKVYQKLTSARKNLKAAQTGVLITKVINPSVMAFCRELAGPDSSLLVVANTGWEAQTVDVRSFASVPEDLVFYTGSLDAEYNHADNVTASQVTVPPRGGLVFLYVSMSGATSAVVSSFLLMVAALFKFL